MAIGTALVQPQRFQRASNQATENAFIDDFVNLAMRLLLDPEQAQPILQALEQAFDAMVQHFVNQDGIDLDNALTRLRAWMQPVLKALDTFQDNLSGIEDADDVLDVLADLVTALAQVASNLTIAELRQHITELLDILESELGLTLAYLEEQVRMLIDDIIDTLRQLPPEPSPEARATRQAVISFLGRVQRLIRQGFQLPPLNADQIASTVLDLLRRYGLDQFAAKGADIATTVRDFVTTSRTLIDLGGVAAFGPGSVGAAQAPGFGDEYRWYASWLLKDKTRSGITFAFLSGLPGFPGDDVWRTEDGRQLVQRNVRREDVVLHEGENIKWHEAPLFKDTSLEEHYTFTDRLNPDFLEGWTRHTSTWIADVTKFVLHFIGAFEQGDRASNISHASWTFVIGIIEQIIQRPFVSWLNSGFGGPQITRWPLGWFAPLAITLLAATEGRHTQADERKGLNWFTPFLDDGLEALTYDIVANILRDLPLSIFTLINYQESTLPTGETRRPLNGRHLDVLVTLVLVGTNELLLKLVTREDYAHPFTGDAERNVNMWIGLMVFANLAVTSFGVLLGVLVAFILMRATDSSVIAQPFLSFNVRNILLFWLTVFLSKEGDTDSGQYNPQGGAPFSGYPDHETSPYKLPYEQDKSVFCPQGNQGFFSHNKITNDRQVYAYDLALDQDNEILAARAGTVVDFFDWVENDQDVDTSAPPRMDPPTPRDEWPHIDQTMTRNWNFILIRHDVDDSDAAISPQPGSRSQCRRRHGDHLCRLWPWAARQRPRISQTAYGKR